MSTSENCLRLTRRVSVSLTAAVMFLACWPPTPARGQCSPQELAKLIASDASASDEFGVSIAMSGDTAVIGAHLDNHSGWNDAGSAYVFVRSGGVWTEQARLAASDAAEFDNFGRSVTLSGDTAVVGAYNDDHTGGNDAGSAYVFVRTGSVWTEQAKLTASDAVNEDHFGVSVALTGDTLVIGANGDDHAGAVDAGSAYVFVRTGSVWTQQAKLIASDAAAFDEFGYSVAVSGDTVVVGAWLDDLLGTDSGAAYVFVRVGGVWTQQARLTATNSQFGVSVAVSGDTALVGAHVASHLGGTNAGAAYVFTRSGIVWTQQQMLLAYDAKAVDRFGFSVAFSGDTAVVGARFDDHPGLTDAGSAYFFVRTGGVWTEQARVNASDAAANDRFGTSVALSGDTAVVGAYLDDHAGGTDAGSVYVFGLGQLDSDGDGVGDVCDVCPNTAPGLPVDSTGRPHRDCNNDCLLNGLDIDCIVAEMLD